MSKEKGTGKVTEITMGHIMLLRKVPIDLYLASMNIAQAATRAAFAAVLGDGSVAAWGAKGCGGDCSAVAELLQASCPEDHGRQKYPKEWLKGHHVGYFGGPGTFCN